VEYGRASRLSSGPRVPAVSYRRMKCGRATTCSRSSRLRTPAASRHCA
jgi:hypothetical protein